MNNQDIAFKVVNLYAGYGNISVLKGVSLDVNYGEIVAIIGANGAGKTTLMKVLSGIHNQTSRGQTSGDIFFQGQNINNYDAPTRVESGIVLVPEGRKIFPKLTVLENLEIGAFTIKDKNQVKYDIEKNCELFPILKERLSQLGGTLSGGEQQMLAIARALMSRPKILLMDEPSMGVAPKIVIRIFDTIKELNKQGLTVLLVEQNASKALELADRAFVLELGEIVLSGEGKSLLSDPRIQDAYLGEI